MHFRSSSYCFSHWPKHQLAIFTPESGGILCGTNGDCLSQKGPSFSSCRMFHGWQLLLTAEHAAPLVLAHCHHLALVLTTVGFGRRAQELVCSLKKRDISSKQLVCLQWLQCDTSVFLYYLVCLQWLLCEDISGKLRFSAKERLVQLLLRLSYVDRWNGYQC